VSATSILCLDRRDTNWLLKNSAEPPLRSERSVRKAARITTTPLHSCGQPAIRADPCHPRYESSVAKKVPRISVHRRFRRIASMDVQVTRFPETDQETALENGQGKETGQAREEARPVRLGFLMGNFLWWSAASPTRSTLPVLTAVRGFSNVRRVCPWGDRPERPVAPCPRASRAACGLRAQIRPDRAGAAARCSRSLRA